MLVTKQGANITRPFRRSVSVSREATPLIVRQGTFTKDEPSQILIADSKFVEKNDSCQDVSR